MNFLSLASTCRYLHDVCQRSLPTLDQAVSDWCKAAEFPFQKKLDALTPDVRVQYMWIKRYLKTIRDAPDRGLIKPPGDPRHAALWRMLVELYEFPFEFNQVVGLHEFQVHLSTPDQTSPYYGRTFHYHVRVPCSYPWVAPSIHCLNPPFHPGYSMTTGKMCVDLMFHDGGGWSPGYSLEKVFLLIQTHLAWPHGVAQQAGPDSINTEAAQFFAQDQAGFFKRARIE